MSKALLLRVNARSHLWDSRVHHRVARAHTLECGVSPAVMRLNIGSVGTHSIWRSGQPPFLRAGTEALGLRSPVSTLRSGQSQARSLRRHSRTSCIDPVWAGSRPPHADG